MTSTQILEQLQHPTGLFSAAKKEVSTGYDKAWIRDNIYMALGIEALNPSEAVKTYHALLDILKKHEYKIDWAIKEKPSHAYQYIHARFHPLTFEEFYEEWGNKQNDAIGLLLFKIGDLEEKGIKVLRDEHDLHLLQKLVHYLSSIEYWQDKDNGIWEEYEEVHASSVGACVAGLKKISSFVSVSSELIQKGEDALNKLLPNESETKEVDLALLTLIWPLNIVSKEQADLILNNVETKLLREKGVIRYIGDKYYNNGSEASWTMGLPWLALIYKKLGNAQKYITYMEKTSQAMNAYGELPELYYANSNEHNENTPLGWAQALYINALI